MPTEILLVYMDWLQWILATSPVWERSCRQRDTWQTIGEWYGRAGGEQKNPGLLAGQDDWMTLHLDHKCVCSIELNLDHLMAMEN